MPFDIELRSSAAAATVLRAIRKHGAYWQESLIPEDLRERGVLGVEARVAGKQFSLFTKEFQRPQAVWAVVRGEVADISGGGAVVRARVGLSPQTIWLGPAFFFFVAIAGAASGSGLWVVGLFGAIGLGVKLRYQALDECISRETGEGARHLAERLELAVRKAEAMEPLAPRA